jgi:hypothetical protein
MIARLLAALERIAAALEAIADAADARLAYAAGRKTETHERNLDLLVADRLRSTSVSVEANGTAAAFKAGHERGPA